MRGPQAASDWVASQVLHICGQLSPLTSSVERLLINIQPQSDDEEDIERWLQLLGAFGSVRDLYLWCNWWGRGFGLLRAACSGRVHRGGKDPGGVAGAAHHPNEQNSTLGRDMHGIAAFADARRRTGRPVMVCEGPRSSQEFEDWDATSQTRPLFFPLRTNPRRLPPQSAWPLPTISAERPLGPN